VSGKRPTNIENNKEKISGIKRNKDLRVRNPFYFKKLAIKSFYSLKYRRICKI